MIYVHFILTVIIVPEEKHEALLSCRPSYCKGRLTKVSTVDTSASEPPINFQPRKGNYTYGYYLIKGTYSLTPWSRVLPEKLTGPKLV